MKSLTANSLATGEVVFWNHGRWAVSFSDAERFADDEAAAAALAVAESQPTIAVAAYLIDVEPVEGGYVPVSYRERLRALGPSNSPDHGKQADGNADVATLTAAAFAARSTGRVKLIKR